MIEAALRAAVERATGVERVGSLSTQGTRLARLCGRAGDRIGIEAVQVFGRVQREYVEAALSRLSGPDPEDFVPGDGNGRLSSSARTNLAGL
ncbi:hypothetical protein [Streptomyces lydicus]|uniref:hypothetical protein n=1 Tax=Streptomyces lydicus TaxID=47763 RepID=UPI0036F896C8